MYSNTQHVNPVYSLIDLYMHIYRHNIFFNSIIHDTLEIAMLIGRWTRKLGTVLDVDSKPTVDKNVSFCKFRLFLVPRSSTCPIQMKTIMAFIQDNMCKERKIILKVAA